MPPRPQGASAVEPRLAVDVLSPSTMNFDRFRKVELYKSVPSIVYVVLVDTEKRSSRCTSAKASAGRCTTLDAVVELPAIEARLAAREVFEGLPFAG